MKRSLLLLLSLIYVTTVIADDDLSKGTITMQIVDSKSDEAMVGAVVNITEDGERYLYNSTKGDGTLSFPSIAYGEYQLEATFMGYDTIKRSVVLDRDFIDLGRLQMNFRSRVIDRVEVQTNSIRTSQSGDTVIYNADSFKVTADAVAEGLLAKMPGITVDDGEVEAQGEEVKRVYLDGKEFFGEDVSLAVKNIPADIIAKVEVFNKLSDNAEFTGFDDGDSYKAINIVTKTGMNRGQFGKFVAGYASDNLYQVSANYNYFAADHRISIIGSSNNMNIKGFSSMSVGGGSRGGSGGRQMIGGAGSFSSGGGSGSSGSGVTTQSGIGFNYGGGFLDDKLKLEASYFYNMSDNVLDKITDREYITDVDELKRYYDAVSSSNTDNMNHRFNAKVEYKPNSRHSLMMRPEFAFQDNGSLSASVVDNDESVDGVVMSDLNDTESLVSSDKEAFSLSNNLVYRVLVGMQGRNITLTVNGSYSQNDNLSLSSYITTYPETSESEDSVTKQNIVNDTESYSLSSSVMYSEPIMKKSAMLTMTYRVNYRYSDADYKVYDWMEVESAFDPDYDPTSSNIYNSGYLTQSVGPGIMYNKRNSVQLNASVSYQHAALANAQEIPVVTPSDQRYNFDNIVYNMSMRKTFNSTNTLRVMLRSSTDNPSVSELQDVVKDSNPQSVSSGNPLLEPSYSNTLRATYVRSSINKGRTFMAMLSGGYTSNSIEDSTIMLLTADDTYTLPNGEELEQYGEYTMPVNLDGKWNVATSVSFGTPVNLIYSNVNLDLGVNYSQTPSILNGENNISRTTNYKAGVTLGSNISENADFTLKYNGGYNVANYENEIDGVSSQDNEYLTQSASATFKFVFWKGITLSGSSNFSHYWGVTDDFDEKYLICNLYLGKKLFKNNRGEITVGVNDIFDQTENFSRNITDKYIENVWSNSIGRYYGFKFTFDLRKFNGSQIPLGRGERGERGGMGEGSMGRGGMGGMSGGMGGRGGM